MPLGARNGFWYLLYNTLLYLGVLVCLPFWLFVRLVRGRYRGCEIFGAPPPSSGGLCTVLTMNMLEPLRLRDRSLENTK